MSISLPKKNSAHPCWWGHQQGLVPHKVFILIFFLFAGCKTFKPVAPAESYSDFIFKPEISEINIPVEIPLAAIENTINQKFTGLLYEDNDLNDNGGDNMMMKVWKKENIAIDMNGDQISYKIPLRIWLKAGWKVHTLGLGASDYKETEFSLVLKFVTKVSIDQKWNVLTKTRSDGYDWINAPTIKIGIFDIPIKFVADRILKSKQESFSELIDQQAKEYLLIKKDIENTWRLIQQPVQLTSDPPVWLRIVPKELMMTPFLGHQGKIKSSIGLKALAETIVGDKPNVTVVDSLPLLKITKQTANEFSISLTSDIGFGYAEKLAEKNLKGQIYTFKNGKYKVKVEEVDLYGSGNKLIVKLGLSESLEGNVFLRGVPYYDSATATLKVKDLDYDIETKNKLLKSADWLGHAGFVKKIEPFLQYSLATELAETKKLIEEYLSNKKIAKGVLLNGKLTHLYPKQVILTPSGLKAIIQAKGAVDLKIEGLE